MEGNLFKSERSPSFGVELVAKNIDMLGKVDYSDNYAWLGKKSRWIT